MLFYRIGVVLDWLHIPLAVLFLPLGVMWLPVEIASLISVSVGISQCIFLGCPLNVLTCWLRKKGDPDYNFHGSIVYWLYNEYGRIMILPFAFYYTVMIYLGWKVFKL